MTRVRYPDGTELVYSAGSKLERWGAGTAIKNETEGWLCWVSDATGHVIEWVSPNSVENHLRDRTVVGDAERTLANLEELARSWPGIAVLRRLKKALARFNAKTGDYAP